MEYEHILYAVEGNIARVTMNRPEVLNAFDLRTIAELTDAYRRIADDPVVGVVVLTGTGDRAFSAGGDVRAEAEGMLEEHRIENQTRILYGLMRDCGKPTIARISGWAVGAGNHLAYVCDFTIAAEHSRFGQNGPRVGSPAQGWMVSYLVRVLGAKRAREMWMLCRHYTAQQMLEWGLVNAVVPLEELDDEVQRWCDELLSMSPTVIRMVKQTFEDEYEPLREFQNARDYTEMINPDFFTSGEQMEGASAFLEKRPPDFSRWR